MNTLVLQGQDLGAGETAALEQAAALLQHVLQEGSGQLWQVAVTIDAKVLQTDNAVLIISMLAALEDSTEPWLVAKTRLRAVYAELAQRSRLPFFVCTLLRCVPADQPDAPTRLVRLRRLNLLAMELSQAIGCTVIDIDRALADIGANRLATDYRLNGGHAAAATARCMALTILAAGLDDLIRYDLQEAARALIMSQPIDLARTSDTAAPAAARSIQRPGNLLRIQSGRHSQTAAFTYGETESRIALYRRLIRSGQLRPQEILRMVARSLRKHGARGIARNILAFSKNRR